MFAADAKFQIAGASETGPAGIKANGIREFRPLLAFMIKTFKLGALNNPHHGNPGRPGDRPLAGQRSIANYRSDGADRVDRCGGSSRRQGRELQ